MKLLKAVVVAGKTRQGYKEQLELIPLLKGKQQQQCPQKYFSQFRCSDHEVETKREIKKNESLCTITVSARSHKTIVQEKRLSDVVYVDRE